MPRMFLPGIHELVASTVPVGKYTKNGEYSRNVVLEEWRYAKNIETGEYEKVELVSSIEIKDLPENVFVFSADAFPQPQALFNDVREVRKRADFILIAKAPDKQRIVFIEMKRTKDSEHGIVAQLRGAACIMDYCNSILKYFWGDSAVVSDYVPRFVSCSHNSAKRGTRADRTAPIHDIPDRLLKLCGKSFTYQQLIRN